MGGEFWYVGNDELPLGVVFKSTAIVKETIVIMHCSTHSHRHAIHACMHLHSPIISSIEDFSEAGEVSWSLHNDHFTCIDCDVGCIFQ